MNCCNANYRQKINDNIGIHALMQEVNPGVCSSLRWKQINWKTFKCVL